MPSKHHVVTVLLRGNEAVPSEPLPELRLGDTVRYTSPDGKLTIVFREDVFIDDKPRDPSPFVASDGGPMLTVKGDTTVTVGRTGEFVCGCNITLENPHRVIGWEPKNPKDHALSGGSHHVPDKRH